MTNFAKKHPNIASVVSVILFFVMMAVLSALTGCKSSHQVVTIVTTDTLHVYHTDTFKVVHSDTIYSVKKETKHDSIIIREKYYLDADGNITLTEKEKESFHNNVKDNQFIQHTVDSIVRAKVDSIYNASHTNKTEVVKEEKKLSLWDKVKIWLNGAKTSIFAVSLFAIFLFFSPEIRLIISKIKDKIKRPK